MNKTGCGISGRINKYADSCYTFWVGATLKILGCEDFLDEEEITPFVLECTSETGGFKKYPFSKKADPVHTCHSLYGLSILK